MKKKTISKKPVGPISKKPALSGSQRIKLPKPPGKGEIRPDFSSLFEPSIPNPLAEYDDEEVNPGEVEMIANREVSVALQTVLDERKQNRDSYRIARSEDYYVIVCFQSTEQKDTFLRETGLQQFVEYVQWSENRFLNGLKVAQHLGVYIEPINILKPTRPNVPVLLRDQKVIK